MSQHYTGQQLHDAHYNDLLNEAEGGWRLRAAEEAGQPRRVYRKLVWTLVGMGIVLAVAALAMVAVVNVV
jgi:hypothetical protein